MSVKRRTYFASLFRRRQSTMEYRLFECGTDANRWPDILAPSPAAEAGQGLPTRVAITAAITASTAAAILIFAVLMVIL